MKRFTLIAILLIGCFDAIQAPITAEWFAPPKEYRLWFGETEQCSGLHRPPHYFDVLWFYKVPGPSNFVTSDGKNADGQWMAPHNIYIAEYVLNDERVVKHEILHDLIANGGGNGNPSHDRVEWRKCNI